VSFAAITLCVASHRMFIVVRVYFVIDSGVSGEWSASRSCRLDRYRCAVNSVIPETTGIQQNVGTQVGRRIEDTQH